MIQKVLLTVLLVASFSQLMLKAGAADSEKRPPNIVLVFADDLGYGDVACFHETKIRTPNIDRLAATGTRFTNFYVAQAVCTASRAALMTGCYANRVGLAGALNHTSQNGINSDEELLPELLKQAGYATGIFGKWHLGLSPQFSPLKNGFDSYFGIPYSNDNSKYHPVLSKSMPPLPLYRDDRVIELDADQSLFTRRITEGCVEFIESNREQPFFLYVPHIMPHVPIFASDRFRGRSSEGLYGDVIEEIDWSVGEIYKAVQDAGVADNTLFIFTSDNGPFLSYGGHAGSAGPLREGKLNTFEGGVRVPAVMSWPGRIPVNAVNDIPLMSIDLLPTLCGFAGASLPQKTIDGLDSREVVLGQAQGALHESFVFYSGSELHAIRSGNWKLHFPHKYLTPRDDLRNDGKPAGYGKLKPLSITQSGVEGIASRHGYRVEKIELSLFDLSNDVGEQHNVAEAHPEIVKKLTALADEYRSQLGDSLQERVGGEVRPVGRMVAKGE